MMMLLHAKTLETFTMSARDGELGHLNDFFVDSHTLQLRYFVGDTRTWFFGGKVLLSTKAFKEIDKENGSISVDATKQQIKDSPKPDEQAPINRYYERELNNHYGWPTYWGTPAVPVTSTYGTNAAAGAPLIPPVYVPNSENPEGTDEAIKTGTDEQQMEKMQQDQIHLFSLDELRGYHVHAKGGEVGKIIDFVVEKSDDWHVRYMVIDTGGFMQKEPVLLSMSALKDVTWFDKTLTVSVEKKRIETAPEHEKENPITREYEASLHAHYSLKPYWEL